MLGTVGKAWYFDLDKHNSFNCRKVQNKVFPNSRDENAYN